ncbi:FK506-binding protein 2 [Ophiocordyceps camponoti-floridani]|uniref:peptidylprolyl isomerase n=1 Tax=Ophiocordyceps camponoti-floridani TaxID=2030778 RepID=A0A8H4Q815_9HYPO|nr:FK506-binding protein 2 [Ophiocordyceps camponoti-floridani]
MRVAPFVVVLASIFLSLVAAAEKLQSDTTLHVKCDRKTMKGDNVSMHYKGTLKSSGEKFDASYDRNQPLTFRLGAGEVIKGWDEGLLDMCIGEKRTLTIPPELGYGHRAMGPIPAGSTLVFETELVAIAGVPKPDKIETIAPDTPIAEQVGSIVSDAADAAKTMMMDTDDVQGHEEL